MYALAILACSSFKQNFDSAQPCFREIQVTHDGSFSHDEGRQQDEDKNIQSCIYLEHDGYFFQEMALLYAVADIFFTNSFAVCSDGFFAAKDIFYIQRKKW